MTKELDALEIIKNITICKEQDTKAGIVKVHFASEVYEEQIYIIETALEALKIIKEHKLLNYVLKNKKCAKMYNLSSQDEETLRRVK